MRIDFLPCFDFLRSLIAETLDLQVISFSSTAFQKSGAFEMGHTFFEQVSVDSCKVKLNRHLCFIKGCVSPFHPERTAVCDFFLSQSHQKSLYYQALSGSQYSIPRRRESPNKQVRVGWATPSWNHWSLGSVLCDLSLLFDLQT